MGDYEGDTVYGSVGKGYLVTAVDRQSRLTVAAIAKDKSKEATNAAFAAAFRKGDLVPLGAFAGKGHAVKKREERGITSLFAWAGGGGFAKSNPSIRKEGAFCSLFPYRREGLCPSAAPKKTSKNR